MADTNKPEVRWTPAHLDALERMFPEQPHETDCNKLLTNAGNRQVVHYVRGRVNIQSQRASPLE